MKKLKEDLYKLATSKKVIQKAAEESACIMRIEKKLYRWRDGEGVGADSVAMMIFEDVKKTINKSK